MKNFHTNISIDHILSLFEIFDWWYPQRMVDETGMKPDRVKYLIKLRKSFLNAADSAHEITEQQGDILETFMKGLTFIESKLLEELLPTSVDGNKFKFVDLFAGIGGIRKPFSDIGGKCVLTCEWDDYANKTYKANWKNTVDHEFVEDIKTITQPKGKDGKPVTGGKQIEHVMNFMPEHDVLLAGFPCQPFSIAGVSKKNSLKRMHGFDSEDQGQLFFDICRI